MTSPPTDRDAAPVIEASSASLVIDGRPILHDVDVSISSGEVVALLGANGSGKSTLVQAIVGLRQLTAGATRLFGVPTESFDQWPRLGYVPQRSSIGQGVPASVREVVTSGRLPRRRLLRPLTADDRAAVDAALDVVDLTDRAHQPVNTLSGGQQQRVLMARTLAGEPDVLILDEPNAGVDLASQQAIANALARRIEAGATVLVVLHELGPFEPLMTRALVLSSGRLIHDGTPEQVARLSDHDHHHLISEPSGVVPLEPLLGLEDER